MPQLDPLETEIVQAVFELPERARQEHWPGDTEWTRAVKISIARIGHHHGYAVCASGLAGIPELAAGQCYGEWLYDLTFLEYREYEWGKALARVPLILECEFGGRDQIDDDFQKLLVGRAEHRVMIFQLRVFDHLQDQVVAFAGTRQGDRYIFLGLDNATSTFAHRLFIAP
jgi:hypothetical protein